jgi:hypothetical protein
MIFSRMAKIGTKGSIVDPSRSGACVAGINLRKPGLLVALTILILVGIIFRSAADERGLIRFISEHGRNYNGDGFVYMQAQLTIRDTDRSHTQTNSNKPEKMSLPVAFTVIGCVKGGKFKSGLYSFEVELYNNGKWQAASLDPYEGKTIQIDGMLSPGDHLNASKFTIIDERCRLDLHSSKFI